MRRATPTATESAQVHGDPDAIFASAKQVIEARYEVPFQGHTAIGPAHALADPSDGLMTIYSNDMKSYGLRNGVATFLGMPREKVRVVYMDGPQVYGRTAADDAGFEAAFLAKELGRPVRMQWTRDEETGWDTKGPPYAFKLRGALDGQGRIAALEYDAIAADHAHLWYNEPDTVLIAQLMGRRPAQPAKGNAETPSVQYAIPNQRLSARIVALPLVWETPLRTGNLRDPNGPQVTFAFESFIDEMATTTKADPVKFRLDMIAGSKEDNVFRRARSLAVVEAAARAHGWDTRPSPRPRAAAARGRVLTGRGIAYTYRSATIAAVIAEVEVNRDTGRVWVKRLVCAHDCGLVINPEGLRHTVECGMLHALSRALWEEVQFDGEKVTSIDWSSYPSLRHSDAPERIDIVLVNGDPNPQRPDLPPYGAGEGSHKPVIAAVANAVFDATGVRLRRPPFRSERVKQALAAS
jgi:CO/xanthine dehydrogenase Mo-binding subunit